MHTDDQMERWQRRQCLFGSVRQVSPGIQGQILFPAAPWRPYSGDSQRFMQGKEEKQRRRYRTLAEVEIHLWLRYCEATLGNVIFNVSCSDRLEKAEIILPSGYSFSPNALMDDFFHNALSTHDHSILEYGVVYTAYTNAHVRLRQAYIARLS
jgi:hypothetical protein